MNIFKKALQQDKTRIKARRQKPTRTVVTIVTVKKCPIERALERKEHEWHDPDWFENDEY